VVPADLECENGDEPAWARLINPALWARHGAGRASCEGKGTFAIQIAAAA